MANNISPGLNFLVAAASLPWNEIPLTLDDTFEIYKTSNGNPVSWRPGRTINTLSDPGIISGTGYMLNSKVGRDLVGIFGPPISGGGGIVTMK